MYWKETGDLGVWKGIAQDALIMNIDDLLCVGAVDNIMVSSTIGRNKLLLPGEVISAIINGTDELLAELREMGVGDVYKRQVYNINGEKLVMVATDRISAFDVVLPKGIPFKGQMLNRCV